MEILIMILGIMAIGICIILCGYLISKLSVKVSYKNILKIILCSIYALAIYKFLFRPYMLSGNGDFTLYEYFTRTLSLKPFHTLSIYLEDKNYFPIFGSIAITVPMYPLVSFNVTDVFSKKSYFIIPLIFIILIEPIQLLTNIVTRFPNWVIDIDDLILNLIGYLIGFILTKIAYKIFSGVHKNNYKVVNA
ncbi:MAG: VanZ family protein [Tyzzerella sp.]|uniref:VanZ family protein n=1 Tax=Candidatus Fimicola merdigallinarum TaxID=2840819 RepID=A0A9D9DXA3_9FIRM|nr:VanZ family protein [Candidatus Fimicola merdigallinarum]